MEEIFPLPLVTNDLSAMLLTTIGNCSKENSKHLAMVQNAVVYYQCLVTKRKIGTTNTEGRDAHAKQNYLDHTVPAFFAWWDKSCKLPIPAWLTPKLMGRSTLTDRTNRLCTVDGAIWSKYSEAGKVIKRDFNLLWDSLRTADGELPSGQQETDAWENLQDGLYYTWKKENEKVKMGNKRNKAAKNNPVVLTGGEGDQTLSGESTAAREKAQQQSEEEVAAARQGATADSQSAPISTVSAVAAKWMAQQAAESVRADITGTKEGQA
ncbi:unnamed protein product, partial [Pylaiella littoralis]